MNRPGRRLELVCTLCNQLLAHAQLQQMCIMAEDDNSNSHSPGMSTPKKNGSSRPEKCVLEEKDQVVATKCGHMFHVMFIKNPIKLNLSINGRGGGGAGLFCPICTKPFAMNRLWKVIIPATKAQRERYEQFHLMKAQNSEMHQQLQGIRSKIAESEKELNKIKEDSEECLNDIQAKQKLLDSISGPTNKEMAELTKLHMKRQEILHVVTQHNADLLKLLAEESNLSSKDNNSLQPNEPVPDYNQNYIPQVQPSIKLDAFKQQQHNSGAGFYNDDVQVSHKSSRKLKKKKQNSKKDRRRNRNPSRSRSKSVIPKSKIDSETPCLLPAPPPPSQIASFPSTTSGTGRVGGAAVINAAKPQECRKVDTCMRWEAESMLEPMNERSSLSFSESGVPLIPLFIKKDKDKERLPPAPVQDELQRKQIQQQPAPLPSAVQSQDSVNILLARKAPMKKGGDTRWEYN
ncbi:hypothetical protein Ocin01_03785 [Orchesella cincta]|uniref:Uncharacterized protein n=1 Tax=Orchesella cincta TaxID=48709 RepID=A0A1D2NCB8_ORCCI|nr:hypothetical protein Ocin01_03785 [Orchesella cincta]